MRCSYMNLAAKCRARYKLNTKYGYGSEAATEGTAFHKLVRYKILNEPIPFTEVQIKYGLTNDQLQSLRSAIYNVDINIPESANLFLETKLKAKELNLEGSPDLFFIQNTKCALVDWKYGFNEVEAPETNLQLICYAYLILERYQKVQEITMIIASIRLKQMHSCKFTREQVLSYKPALESIITEAESKKPEYTIGAHCRNCYANLHCPAFSKQVVSFSNILNDTKSLSVKDNLTKLLPFAKALNIVTRRIEDLAKTFVDTNGELKLDDGSKYIKTLSYTKKINAKKAYPILEQFFKDEREDIIKLSIKDIVDFARTKERGLAKKILAELEEVGAIEQKSLIRYEIIKNEGKKS